MFGAIEVMVTQRDNSLLTTTTQIKLWRERDRQTDRQTDRERDRETDRQRDRQTDRQTEREKIF